MIHRDDRIAGYAALGFAGGIYIFFKGFREFRKYRVIADTPEIPIRSVPMGFVEVHGKAQGEQPIPSPVSHTPCFAYKVEIEEWKTSSRSRSGGWHHYRTDVDGMKFYLADGSGKVLVDPRGADLDLPQITRREARSGVSASTGPGATNEELLKYVTQAGVHMFSGLAERGLGAVGPLGDPAKEKARQELLGLFANTPGSAGFQNQMMAMMLPRLKQRLEAMGPQSDPKKEQARLAGLEALQYPPGSPQFMEAIQRAQQAAGEKESLTDFFTKMQSGSMMFGAASGHYRFTEYCIVPGESYDISGTCTENPSPRDEYDRNVIERGSNEKTFLISSKTEKQVESGLRWRAVKMILGGAALAVICLAILLAKFGWL
jgi:hypothetical protein